MTRRATNATAYTAPAAARSELAIAPRSPAVREPVPSPARVQVDPALDGNVDPIAGRVGCEVVRIHKRRVGRGASAVRSNWCEHGSGLVVRLIEPYTDAERMLIDRGRFAEVQSLRTTLHRAMEDELREAAEAAVSRDVVAVVSQVVERPQLSCILFLLEP